jgi:RNA polymerase sigma factor (sigma-70 family)
LGASFVLERHDGENWTNAGGHGADDDPTGRGETREGELDERGGRTGDRERDAVVRKALEDGLDRAYRLAGFLLGNAAEAEDATHDAVLRAWSARSSVRDPVSVDAWLDRIVVNACRDRLRRRGKIRWIAIDASTDRAMSDPFAAAIARDEALRGLERLPAERREVVVLRFWADLPLDAIGVRLGIPLGTVKSRLHQALRELRAAYGPAEADPEPEPPR